MKKLILFFCLFAFSAGAQNPQLKITQLNGEVFDLAQQKGKVTLILFWAYWCGNCKRDMPLVEEVYQKYKAKGLEIIAISIDPKRQKEKVLSAAKNYSYKIAVADDVINASFSQPNLIPTYYLIGKNGEFLAEPFKEKSFNKTDFIEILDRSLK